MTDAELDAMLATHAQSEASAIEDDARVAATYRARSYVPVLVAEVRRLNAENERLSLALAASEEMFRVFKELDESAPCAVHNLRYGEHCPDARDNPDKVACRWGIAPSGVPESLRAENERLSLALALAQELADGYKAGLYGDPEPRGMSDAGIVAYHATLSLRRTCERQQKELADAAKDREELEQANDAMRDTMEGR